MSILNAWLGCMMTLLIFVAIVAMLPIEEEEEFPSENHT